MAETKMIRIEYYRSKNSTPTKHRLVVKGLGFTRLNQIVERVDTESTRGFWKTSHQSSVVSYRLKRDSTDN